MDNQKKIIKEIAESLTLLASDLDLESSLKEDLDLNPVEIADLFESLAVKFNILFDPSEMEQVQTLKDLVELIEDKLIE